MRPAGFYEAAKAVTLAVKRGDLVRLSYQFDAGVKCVDCGGVAQCYDHRDYGKPLEVEPVCSRCNYKRGSAKGYEEPPVNFQSLLCSLHERGFSDEMIARGVGVVRTAIYALRVGTNKEPRYSLGVKIVKLHDKTMRQIRRAKNV